ncbi:MAG: ABC transporter ATP-binding protein [Pseudomonadota bacterium]
MNAPLLEASRVTLEYGSRCILSDVSLSLREGEIVALLGASGAGKSSLLRVLAGLQAPTSGALFAFGAPARGGHPDVALAFQDACLLPWRDVERNVAFGLDFASQPVWTRREREQRVKEALAQVELSHAAHYRPRQLSGGMAQRVALARCLARRPRVLLLDEPFGALDEITRREMQRILLNLVRERRTAVALVTHDIDEALLVADRVVLLGHRPAVVKKIWSIECAHPRESSLDALGQLRIDVVKRLHETFPGA